jgi:hypothetical protein
MISWDMVGLDLSGFESIWFGSWYVASVTPMCMSLGLATSGMPMCVVQFWLQL